MLFRLSSSRIVFVAGTAALLFVASCSPPRPVTMVISNPIDLQRINEGVVVPLAKLPGWAAQRPVDIKDQSGRSIPFQRDDIDGDGKPDEIYFQISLAPLESLSLQIQTGEKKAPAPSPFNTLIDHDLISIETPACVLVSKGPEEWQLFVPSRKSSLLTAGYGLQGVKSQESQNRLLSQGPLRVIVEQKALWRSSTEAMILNHRVSMAFGDPLVRSMIEKVRWPQGTGVPSLFFDLEKGDYRLRSFSTRWLLNGEKTKNFSWNAAVLFKAGTLLEPKPVTAGKEGWRQIFNNETSSFSVAWMIAGGSEAASSPDWDRQSERAQQRWLNPIEVFVAE